MNNDNNLNQQKPQPMVSFYNPEDQESKMYLVLIVGSDENGDEFKDFEFITGRKAAYEYIKTIVSYIDLFQSRIVVETETINDTKPVIKFMRYVIDNGLVDDPGFDIMDYVTGDYTEEEEE